MAARGFGVSTDQRKLYVSMLAANAVAVVDTTT
jgi:hypothetical protein